MYSLSQTTLLQSNMITFHLLRTYLCILVILLKCFYMYILMSDACKWAYLVFFFRLFSVNISLDLGAWGRDYLLLHQPLPPTGYYYIFPLKHQCLHNTLILGAFSLLKKFLQVKQWCEWRKFEGKTTSGRINWLLIGRSFNKQLKNKISKDRRLQCGLSFPY